MSKRRENYMVTSYVYPESIDLKLRMKLYENMVTLKAEDLLGALFSKEELEEMGLADAVSSENEASDEA